MKIKLPNMALEPAVPVSPMSAAASADRWADRKPGMQRSFLLDTSAFRAVPADRLETASRSARLYVSPFCFWELLTHLEDDGQFGRVKGNLMKFRHVSVLDDPQAEVDRQVLGSSEKVHARVLDGDLVYAILAALRDSESTQEFYDRSIRDERGQVRQIAGCVSRVREVLQIEENRFQGFIEQIVAAVRTGQVYLTEVSDRDQGVLDLIRGRWLQIGDRIAESADVYEQFVRRMYIYSSYVVHRACEYAARDTIKIDPNDFEDARFCLHLGLDAGTTVVTDDTGLRRCLEAAVETLNAMADGSRHSSLRVCDTTAF